MSIVESEEEAQDGIWNLASQWLLEIDLVSIDHFCWVLSSPWQNNECQVILNHWNHGMRNVLLFLGQSSINVLFESLWQLLDDGCRVANLLTVEFNEWQLSFLGVELELVVDILEGRKWSHEFPFKDNFLMHGQAEMRKISIFQFRNNKKIHPRFWALVSVEKMHQQLYV
jgi:hypothetical protein